MSILRRKRTSAERFHLKAVMFWMNKLYKTAYNNIVEIIAKGDCYRHRKELMIIYWWWESTHITFVCQYLTRYCHYRFKHCSNSSTLAAILHTAGYLGQEKALSSLSLKEDWFIHTGTLLCSCITPLFTCFLLSLTPINKLVLPYFSRVMSLCRIS